MTRVLAPGDHFVLNRLLVGALHREIPEGLEVSELTLPWPVEPFGRVGEVDEASGSEDAMIEALQGVEVCVTQLAPLTEKILEASPDLRLFCVSRGGPVNTNLDAATRHGVAVTFAPGRNATATAEHTLSMMLAAARRIPQTHGDLAGGTWRGDYYSYDKVGPELEDSPVGLVGYVTPEALAGRAEQVELDELLTRSKIVSLHARATPETTGMIGAAQIAAM